MVTDLRLVISPKGHIVLQAEYSMWDGEGHQWRNVRVVHYEGLSDYDKREVDEYEKPESLRNF